MSIAEAFDVLVVAGWLLFFFDLFLPRAGEGLLRGLLDLDEVRPHLQWPVFSRSVVAAFQRSPTLAEPNGSFR